MNQSSGILFVVPYPRSVAPSQRFRVELYEHVLVEAGMKYEIVSFLDADTWHILFKQGHYWEKATGIFKGFLRRIKHLWKARKYHTIFIHREGTPMGPPIVEWILANVMGKKIIYDFDDAIWIPNITASNKLAGMLKSHWKVRYICKWANTVTGGNKYLCDYAASYNKNVLLLPTSVDIKRYHNKIKEHGAGKPVVGWTGSHSTLFYLEEIVPVIRELQERYEFTFLVIADKKPEIDLTDWEFVKWSESSEIEDLLRIDIGIMPLKKDAWSEGKCGFKLIQYLSCGIPAVADPIGVNSQIIQHGVNGYVCETTMEWEERLGELINKPELRQQMGAKGREHIVNNYSIQSQTEKFLNLFR